MTPFLTVSQITNYIYYKFDKDTKLKGIAVKGEISGYVRNFKTGHAYFSLKDEESVIKCVMFSSSVSRLKFSPENGMSIVAIGNVEVYQRDGVYQLKAFEMIPAGAGEEALRLEMLKNELMQMGVFSKPKKPICRYPKEIAVVTSKDAAALGDIITTVERRYPLVKLSVYPTSVQGANAPDEIALALNAADASNADTIIVARGGGSKEDLAAYNTKQVALGIYACTKPVICAVGHEIDVSLADLIADCRAATPTAAAELATPDISVMKSEVEYVTKQMILAMDSRVRSRSMLLDSMDILLGANSPRAKTEHLCEEFDRFDKQMRDVISSRLQLTDFKLSSCVSLLESLNPDNLLKKGYAIMYKDGKIISDESAISAGDEISVMMHFGKVSAKVAEVERNK